MEQTKAFVQWDILLSSLVLFAFLALIIERALYQIFDSRIWKKFEEWLNHQTGSDYLDLKPYISAGISIWAVFQLRIDMLAQVSNSDPTVSTMILTGLFISGGSTGIYKFFKRARQLKEAASQEKIEAIRRAGREKPVNP